MTDTFAHTVTLHHLASGKWRVAHSYMHKDVVGRMFAYKTFPSRKAASAWAFELEKTCIRKCKSPLDNS